MDYYIILDAYKKFWTNYFKFSGRSRRSDYWCAMLITIVLSFVLVNLGRSIAFLMPFYNFFSFMSFIPTLSLNVRRLHDIGKRGWYVIVSAVPLLGIILLAVWFLGDSQPGTNKYGENPKGITSPEL